jgi:hypothetical protein
MLLRRRSSRSENITAAPYAEDPELLSEDSTCADFASGSSLLKARFPALESQAGKESI